MMFCITLSASEKIKVAIYDDAGCWREGITAFENLLTLKNVEYSHISGADIKDGKLSNTKYDILYIPGGMADEYFNKMGFDGFAKIRHFVRSGGGYLGICGGAYLASDSVIWEGKKIDAGLNLFDGTAVGSLKEIIPWDKYTMTDITVNKANPISKYLSSKYSVLYYGGPALYPHKNAIIDTVATWDAYNNAPAIINFKYGKGRVFLSAPHPEIEENSLRDGQEFGNELTDPDSEWDILWAAVDWLAKREITQIPTSVVRTKNSTEQVNVNVIDGQIRFETRSIIGSKINISIYNILGMKVREKQFNNTSFSKILSIKSGGLSTGVYLYIIRTSNYIFTNKFIIK